MTAPNESEQLDLTVTKPEPNKELEQAVARIIKPVQITEAANMLELAIDKNLNVDAIERIVAMCERERADQRRQAFFAAMTDFQVEMPTLEKAKPVCDKGGKELWRYAPIDDIVVLVQPVAHKYGFSHKFDTSPVENGVQATCIIRHIQGHTESTTVFMPYTEGQHTNAAQNRGIIITYAERYAYRAAYGLQAAKDTDAMPNGEPPATITKEQVDKLTALIKEANSTREEVLKYAKVDALSNMSVDSYEKVRTGLNKRVKAHEKIKKQEEENKGIGK